MILIGEDEQFSRYPSHLGGVERGHRLVGQNAVVFLAVDTENRRVPLIDELMRAVGKCALGNRIVFLPVRTAHVPVGEPFLFGLEVLHLQVEDTIVCDERFEATVMMPGQPIDAEPAERGSYATQVVFVHVRLGAELVNRCQIVLHALSAVVTADLLIPRLAEARQTAAVWSDDDIIAGTHHHEVPPEGPGLAHRTLRTALAIEDGRVFLVRIEMRRVDDPGQHILAVRRLLPSRYNGRTLDLVVDIIVLMGQLL